MRTVLPIYVHHIDSIIPISALLSNSVKAYSSSTSLDQQHQSAAKDLTGSPVRSSPSTIQVTYLPSTGQRSKRPKHFLELKSFKDNYNTLESTLWGSDRHVCDDFPLATKIYNRLWPCLQVCAVKFRTKCGSFIILRLYVHIPQKLFGIILWT